MHFRFFLIVLIFGLGLSSCYDMVDAGIDASYLRSSQSSGVPVNNPQDPASDQNNLLHDTVYLKDGSIIHGFIIEEEPGISLQIKSKSGNVYTYQMADVAKITHYHPTNTQDAATDNNNGDTASNDADNSSDDQK